MRCANCGKELLGDETLCPVCNTKSKARKKKLNTLMIIGIVVVAIGVLYFFLPDLIGGPFDDALVGLFSSQLGIPLFIAGLIKNRKQ